MLVVVWELPTELVAPFVLRARSVGTEPEILGNDRHETWLRQTIERDAYGPALDLLSLVSEIDLRTVATDTRSLQEIGIHYAPECCGETWRSWSVILRRGQADCEDLAAAHAAWLRARGFDALAEWREPVAIGHGARLYHAIVATPHGEIDISEILGMRRGLACDVGPCGRACPIDIRTDILR